MLGCNNNDYQGMRYARARKHTRHRASRSRLDGIHLLPQSVRHVSHRPEYLPEQCRRIGVFVNESSENILLKAQNSVCTISSCMAGKHRNNAAN